MSLLSRLAEATTVRREVNPPPRRGMVRVEQVISASQPILDDEHIAKMVAASDNVGEVVRSGGHTMPGTEGYTHVSSLPGICEREQAISFLHGLPMQKNVMGAMRVIWALGRAAEHHVRQGVIKARSGVGVYGRWRCVCGHSEVTADRPPVGQTCHWCRQELKHYAEPLLVDHVSAVVGSPDLTLIEMGWYLVVEIKSMNKEAFDKLEEPEADHILQAMSYRRMYEALGFKVMDYVAIVYVRKDFKWGGRRTTYKEFHVRADQWAGMLNISFETARRINDHIVSGTIPPRTVCGSVDCTRAKDCQRSVVCFSMS